MRKGGGGSETGKGENPVNGQVIAANDWHLVSPGNL